VIYFWRDLLEIGRGFLHPGGGGLHLPILLVVGTVPAGLVGVFFADVIEPLFAAPVSASAGLLLTALLLWAAWRIGTQGRRSLQSLTLLGALFIGLFQAVAIVPGVSRSGATIAAGVFLGLSGKDAARFSFLLSIPAIAGAVLLESGAIAGSSNLSLYLVGAVSAALVGWASIAFLMKLLGKGVLVPFAIYCLVIGILSIAFLV
jgi:undecaprenyl-diphosphatase